MSESKNKSASESNKAQFASLLEYIRTARGFDFTGYKPTTLMRRVSKRMRSLTDVEEFSDYQDYLEVHPEEFNVLFNTVLINVTSFFRDAVAWDYLRRRVIPEIANKKPADEAIRVWSAGCASGEEAYSLEVALAEKEVLLREVNHRVRNNLQLVPTLLYNKSFRLEDLQAIAILRTLQQRVIIMAEIHQQLYRGENIAKIELGSYLQKLLDRFKKAYCSDTNKTQPIVRESYRQAVLTEIDVAHNCGVIVNELFANSINYAFPKDAFAKGQRGEISLSLSSDSRQGKFTLTYGDNGVGLPADLEVTDFKRSSGIRLVHQLVNNMEGKIELDRNNGFKVKITLAKLQ